MENNKTGKPLEHYTAEYRSLDPLPASLRCGVPFDEEQSRFALRFLDNTIYACYPEFDLVPQSPEACPKALLGDYARILILRYLLYGDAVGETPEFISYREFPWGAVYDANFQGRCIKRLAYSFGSREEAFKAAALKLGGIPIGKGDASFEFALLGDVRLRLILYCGDEEFPPSSQFLFSKNSASAFTAEDLAVCGDLIIDALKELSNR